jgi:hypothetical protein
MSACVAQARPLQQRSRGLPMARELQTIILTMDELLHWAGAPKSMRDRAAA